MSSACLTDREIQRLVDQRAPAAERHQIESHAADCDTCRNELVAAWHERQQARDIEPAAVAEPLRRRVQALVPVGANQTSGSPSPLRRPFFLPTRLLLATAALLLVSVLAFQTPRWFESDAVQTPVLRGEDSSSLELVSPAKGAVAGVDAGLSTFTWHGNDDSATVRLVILDSAGERVYEVEAHGTSSMVDTKELGPGDFYWTVSMVRADGSSSSADPRLLHIVK